MCQDWNEFLLTDEEDSTPPTQGQSKGLSDQWSTGSFNIQKLYRSHEAEYKGNNASRKGTHALL